MCVFYHVIKFKNYLEAVGQELIEFKCTVIGIHPDNNDRLHFIISRYKLNFIMKKYVLISY